MPPKFWTLKSRWIWLTKWYTSQLCAGLKIARKPTPLFFSYSGEGRAMTFKKLKYPLKNWKPAHMSVRTKRKIVKEDWFKPRHRLWLDWTSWLVEKTLAGWENSSSFFGDLRNLPGWQWRTTVGEGRRRRTTSCSLFGLSNHWRLCSHQCSFTVYQLSSILLTLLFQR